jgi:hypothetical protein
MVAKAKNSKKNTPAKKKLKSGLLFIVIAIIPAIFYFLFFMNKDTTPEHLEGSWIRTDGGYKIEIKEVSDDGKLTAAYFNPNPINVGSSGWQFKDKKLQIFVELQDKNYPGSLYNLNYNKKTKILEGTYYQAVAKQTFNVSFKKEI